MALIDINVLAGLSSGNYEREVKAILYRDDVVYTSKEVSPAEMVALQKGNQGKFRLGGVEFTCHTAILESQMCIRDRFLSGVSPVWEFITNW